MQGEQPTLEALLVGVDERTDAFFSETQPVLAAEPARALAIGQAAELRAAGFRDRLGVVRGLLLQGMAQSALGHTDRDATLARALALAESAGDPATLLRAVNSQIVVDIYNGRFADALWRGQGVLGLAHALRRDDLLWRLVVNIGSALSLIGEFEMAIAMYGECLDLLASPRDAAQQQQRHQTVNNLAWSWLGLSRNFAQEGREGPALAALASARRFAEDACEGALQQSFGSLRASALDTLVSVLLEQGDASQALRWVTRVTELSAELLPTDTPAWGLVVLARCRAELATEGCELQSILERLKAVEALPGPTFRSGGPHAALNRSLYEVLQAMGAFRESLSYHRKWLQFESQRQSLLAREHAMAVHRTLESLHGETEEFITHDLRNPLGAALVQLRHSETTLDQLPGTSAIRQRVVQLASRVSGVLAEADRYLIVLRLRSLRRTDLKEVDLAELVDDVAEELAPLTGAHARLEREVEWGLTIRADRISWSRFMMEMLHAGLTAAQPTDRVTWQLCREGAQAVLRLSGPDFAWLTRTRDLWVAANHSSGLTLYEKTLQLHDAQLCWAAPGDFAVPSVWCVIPILSAAEHRLAG